MTPSRLLVRRYLATTFGITWSSWWTLAALGGIDRGPVPLLLVGGSGPLVAVGFGLLAGIGEEPGWRGTLLRPWIEQHGRLQASVLVGAVWALWHLPLYFAGGTYQADRGLGWFVVSFLELPALSLLLTWTYERSGWLVAAPLLAHALGNAAGEILPAQGTAADMAQSAAIIAAGLAIGSRFYEPLRQHP